RLSARPQCSRRAGVAASAPRHGSTFLESRLVRRRLRFALLAGVLLALALAGTAVAANGGFTPVTPHSPNAHRINSSYYFILGFTAFVFVLVEAALVVFVVRFRSRGRARDVEGPQIHGNTNIELAWTVGPVVILALIAG